jgi:hypothetical protein
MALGDNLLAKIPEQTGKQLDDFVALAQKAGLGEPGTKPGELITWLKTEHSLGHGYAMALAHYIIGKIGK